MSGIVAAELGSSFPFIPALILVPLITAVIVAVVPTRSEATVRQIAVIGSLLTSALCVFMLVAFKTEGGYQFVVDHAWVKALGISWHMGIDGISLWLVVLCGLLFPIALLGARVDHDQKAYYAWMMVLFAGSVGVFCALDLVVFFAFFEIVLIPMYFLIGIWGHGNRRYAANKFFLFTMFGSALMLVGIIALAFLHQRATGQLTFDLVKLAENPAISKTAARWIFLAFALAFSIKVPLFPLHTWLPDAHTEAPTAGSVILAGVMLKMGTYGLMRFGLYLFPEATVWFAPVMLTLGVIGIVYGAICATMQRDLKRVVAYSSVAHMGFIVIGIFALTRNGLEGGVLQSVNHGITTPALFLLVGWIYERRHTRDIGTLTGLQSAAPIFAGVFTLVMMASIGLPGLNGFVGEFLTLIGTWESHRWWAVVAATGVILAALYLLWAYQRVFHGKAEGENAKMRELKLVEAAVIAPLLALIVFLGLYPKPVLDRISPSVKELLHHIETTTGYREPTPPDTAAVESTESAESSAGAGQVRVALEATRQSGAAHIGGGQ